MLLSLLSLTGRSLCRATQKITGNYIPITPPTAPQLTYMIDKLLLTYKEAMSNWSSSVAGSKKLGGGFRNGVKVKLKQTSPDYVPPKYTEAQRAVNKRDYYNQSPSYRKTSAKLARASKFRRRLTLLFELKGKKFVRGAVEWHNAVAAFDESERIRGTRGRRKKPR